MNDYIPPKTMGVITYPYHNHSHSMSIREPRVFRCELQLPKTMNAYQYISYHFQEDTDKNTVGWYIKIAFIQIVINRGRPVKCFEGIDFCLFTSGASCPLIRLVPSVCVILRRLGRLHCGLHFVPNELSTTDVLRRCFRQ